MSVQNRIEQKLTTLLAPTYLEVENESHKHHVPPGSESHFRVLIVSGQFEGMSRIDRQRLLNQALAEFMSPGGVHALAQRCLTPGEYETSSAFQSPPCSGGSKR